ncbi:MAG: DUF3267 domain-containing protein [Bacilli bacterium]|nr:DUF3267 domain-containing protein [Bacilli bacterium]
MAKLKMIGIIKENQINKYQKYNTSEKMVLIVGDKDNIQIKAIPICIVFILLCILCLFLKVFYSSIIINPVIAIIGFLIGFMLLIVHEVLHGIVYPKNVSVSIGFIPPITFVALASYPMSKKRFILMCLLPFVLGVIPLLILIIFNNSIICSLCIGLMFFGMISPYPDVYNVIQVIKKVPKNKKVLFYEDSLVYID